MNEAFDNATRYVGDLDAARAAYGVAFMVVVSAAFIYVLNRSGFRAMVAVGKA